MAAARHLIGENIRISVAGPVHITAESMATAPLNMSFLGRVTRNQLQKVYLDADVFVLPTLSDGFAITQLEAMANGLPVIATPRCGSVVEDGVSGLIVAAGDGDGLANAILAIERDRQLLENMSQAAVRRARQFTMSHYAESLLSQVT
jgi:glycosyltransferase involved in cell wall biosynthesis